MNNLIERKIRRFETRLRRYGGNWSFDRSIIDFMATVRLWCDYHDHDFAAYEIEARESRDVLLKQSRTIGE